MHTLIEKILSAIKAWHYMKSCTFLVGLNDDFADTK